MTRKHFELIAHRFNLQVEAAEGNKLTIATLNNLAIDMAFDFHRINPNFDQARFLKACGF
jgi:hypothetical protein